MEDQLTELSKADSPILLNAFIIRYDSQVLHILVGSEVCLLGAVYPHEY